MTRTGTKITRNSLTMEEQFKLAAALRDMNGELTSGRYTPDTLAEFVSQKLGFAVRPANMLSVIKASGIEAPKFRERRKKLSGFYKTVSDHLAELQRQINVLSARVTHLEESLGVSSSPPKQ